MRIAVSGTHGVGKTTLIEDLAEVLPFYEAVPEPYWLLEQQGVPFANGATIPDLERQLVESCKLILAHAGRDDVIFDRCPLDFVAYLEVVSAGAGFEWLPSGRELADIGKALASLDAVLFVPLQSPDEIVVPIEHPRLRRRVDQRLKTILREDDLGLFDHGPRIVDVAGTRAQRVSAASAFIASLNEADA